jgi:hypothetical protein
VGFEDAAHAAAADFSGDGELVEGVADAHGGSAVWAGDFVVWVEVRHVDGSCAMWAGIGVVVGSGGIHDGFR